MSQYRSEDNSGHPSAEVKSSREIQQNSSLKESIIKSDLQDTSLNPTQAYSPNQARADYDDFVTKSNEFSISRQGTVEYTSKSLNEFSASKTIEPYSKHLHNETEHTHENDDDENYIVTKDDLRQSQTVTTSVAFSGQSKFSSGQNISQLTGPTPTLNQLLQASSPVHRFHSNYPPVGSESYQQAWSMQRPSMVSPVYSQSSTRPSQMVAPRLHHGAGGSNSSSISYQQFSQRFPTTVRSHTPYGHHQLSAYSLTSNHPQNVYNEQRGWNQVISVNTSVTSAANQTYPSSRSPQRALSQSPAPAPVSPQPITSTQTQNFPVLQQRSTTPNTQGIDSAEISGQNSNDSSSGPAGPTTPNSQGMRPTPSPTGSTGSRSMSPAVGQSIQVPPRPSSSQSDSGGPVRMSLSPLTSSQVAVDDPVFTQKIRKELIGYHSHTVTPQNNIPSPSATSINSVHEEYSDINSPGWPRTPASPVYSSHVSQDPFRSKKSDSLSKLYEMDDSGERRPWLDKLVSFMEERRTPITSCPTISKNPLDLFRLYFYVKERGGFMEVCKVTKNKTWKDIAGLLGIGASSSAAYTLRKHYTKHLLAYECHFDRGGVDPQPIINQIEAGSKKKTAKNTSSVPSPGSSNSQDSFPASGSNNPSMESYGSYQNTYSGTANTISTADYNPPARPPSQCNTSSNQSIQPNYQATGPFQSFSQDQYRLQSSNISQQNEFTQSNSYSNRTHFSYGSDNDRNFSSSNITSGSSSNQDIFNRYCGGQQTVPYSSASVPGTRNTYVTSVQHQATASQQSNAQNQSNLGTIYPCSQDYYRQEHNSYASSINTQIYPNSATSNKTMPPPPSGSQQPRRHPDFSKEQYCSYNQQRQTYSGWPVTSNQYNNSTPIRIQYPNQQLSQQIQQSSQTQGPTSSLASSTTSGNSGNQWNNQQNSRSPTQINANAMSQTPTPWDHRYNTSSALYSTTSSHQNQIGINPVINQQSIIKREITFPIDSVEAITPLLFKRKKLIRSDIAPVEAWRIMMALRSGLLAESCWALDVLNILLYDDSCIQYFGLSHLPGLLDVLLEHFSRSLSDMFDSAPINDSCISKTDDDIDLGAVIKHINPEDRATLLSSSNYTLLSRRGKPVKLISRDDDIFILDNRKSWDFQDYETDLDPWQVNSNAIKYIITCFETEINNFSFIRHLRKEKLVVPTNEKKKNYSTMKLNSKNELICTNDTSKELGNIKYCKDSILGEFESKQPEKKKKIKTLNDILSKIKKEPTEINELSQEIFEKKNDKRILKRKNIINSNVSDESNSQLLKKTFIPSSPSDITNKSDLEHVYYDADEKENGYELEEKSNEKKINDIQESMRNFDCLAEIKLNVRDPAGTLKRRRISDYEDESYSKDEASLYLLSETQDNLARRCVCLSTILRNLTFIPGNEIEFAKNITFLSLLGKLLLLHHEHPTRAQKTRNYDREEDADFFDTCSSLVGENEWWWDFLYHVRENVLVIVANIAGYLDLSQYLEEISRPILDGLLHWAVCPAAHGQDPFPTVNLNSSLSPQRLALEALCKLCVTESNVDLVVATPPFSRLQKLCCVLSRLLCRSEEQVLREFGINLLYFLSAADSGVARTIALQTPCIALLVTFIEQAESSALGVANQHGIGALRDNPESMGTSLDMLRRAAGTLLNLSRHPENRTLLLQHESRLLALVMSQILDQQVASIVARVLFQCSRITP